MHNKMEMTMSYMSWMLLPIVTLLVVFKTNLRLINAMLTTLQA